jgi:hypothetical protein
MGQLRLVACQTFVSLITLPEHWGMLPTHKMPLANSVAQRSLVAQLKT